MPFSTVTSAADQMRLSSPRIAPLPDSEWSDEQRELLTRGNPQQVLNIFRTLARHIDMYRRWLPFGNHVLLKSTLPARDREILILRIGHLCRSGYEFHQHTEIGKRAGLTETEIERIKVGPDAAGWQAFERTLLQAADQLHRDAFIGDAAWAALSARYDAKQLIDLVFTVGQYTMVSMALNTFGVQIEGGQQ
jgi:4-carboxymuconolactone decarboxylase